jgi:hypothetical protein
LPKPTIPNIQFGDIGNLLPAAFSLTLLAYVTGIIPARVIAEKKREKLDANQEFIALGVDNLALVSVKDLSLLEVNQGQVPMMLQMVKRSWSVSSPLCCSSFFCSGILRCFERCQS